MFHKLYVTLVTGNQKAIIAFALSFLAGLGITVGGVNILDVTIREALTAGFTAVVTAGGVWLKANNK